MELCNPLVFINEINYKHFSTKGNINPPIHESTCNGKLCSNASLATSNKASVLTCQDYINRAKLIRPFLTSGRESEQTLASCTIITLIMQ